MKRKIIELGHNCLVLSLPRRWVLDNSLAKGDELDVSVLDDGLMLGLTGKKSVLKTIFLKIDSDNDRELRILLVNAYRAGFDKMDIDYKGEKSILTKVVSRNLLGFEVFSKEGGYVVEVVSEPSSDKLEDIARKMVFLLVDMINDLDSDELAEEFLSIRKYDNFIKRCMVKSGKLTVSEVFLWQFLTELSRVARRCRSLNKKELSEKTLSSIKKMAVSLMKGFLSEDVGVLLSVADMEKELFSGSKALYGSSKDVSATHDLLELGRNIFLATSPLIGYIQSKKFSP